MAANAIGDIESLLQGPEIDEGEDDATKSFQDRVLTLVLAALAGRDVKKATELEIQSFEKAKAELEREEANINFMLGSMDGAGYVGPRAPDLGRSLAPELYLEGAAGQRRRQFADQCDCLGANVRNCRGSWSSPSLRRAEAAAACIAENGR